MDIYKGRPEEVSGRSDREISVYDFLDSIGVEYERVDHAPAMTMEDCVAVDKALGAAMCKNLVLTNRQQTFFYLLLMPGDKPFKTKQLSAQINSARLSFANADQMEKLLGVLPGAVTVLALKNDTEHNVNLLVDKDVLKGEYIGCHPCVNTASLRIRTDDLVKLILPATGHKMLEVVL